MNTNEIRAAFLNYFKEQGHEIVASSSLVPGNDPTLLFTNSGMVQFKDVFLGLDERPYNRATTAQRCVRAGGKHNDLENVGYTRRHHTFFEMLGNFSFGNYFKREAIQFAWDVVTKLYCIPQEKLWITVYKEDQESEAIWINEMGVSPKRFSRCGEKDNFWQMGDTGPCGPCTEIFYDHGETVAGGPPGSPDADGDRYVEIWNLVFMQYNRDNKGNLAPLPKPSVDTGMGLERIAAVLQKVHDNYDIDLFQFLLKALAKIIGNNDFSDTSMRVIVDHIRSSAFLIMDGVTPSNEGRGYVLRRIIRRALRHGYRLGQDGPFFYRMVQPLTEIMGDAYPELKERRNLIEEVIHYEEQQFAKTLEKGLKILDQQLQTIENSQIQGSLVFLLYDTYGFPPDLTADIARERGLTIDNDGFEIAMAGQRALSQSSQHFSMDQIKQLHVDGTTEFTGYESLTDHGKVTALFFDENPVSKLNEGERGYVVLDRTPFYAESGGQVGDTGYLYTDTGQFRVKDTQKLGRVYLHIGEMIKGFFTTGAEVKAEVDPSRLDIVLNHSATHLLHEALRRVLGEHVMQKGSLVEAKRLRFDFAHNKPLTPEQLQAVERLVNQQIRANHESVVTEGTLEEAKQSGALALFGEKYADRLRTVKMGEFSHEVCGGTHAHRSGDLGFFKIISESSVASGIRRIEAVTGAHALTWIERNDSQIEQLATLLKVKREKIAEKVVQLQEQHKELERELTQLKQRLANQQSGSLVDQAKQLNGIRVIAAEIPKADTDTLRNTLDNLKSQLGSAAIVLATVSDNKIQMVAGLTQDCLVYFKAGDLLNYVAQQVGGKGGGRADFAQGGGDNPAKLADALQSVFEWISQRMV